MRADGDGTKSGRTKAALVLFVVNAALLQLRVSRPMIGASRIAVKRVASEGSWGPES